jgi:hypothetical protein
MLPEWTGRMELGFEASAGGEPETGIDGDLRAAIKAELEPCETLLWVARACPPPVPAIEVVPALFTALLCGLSGFALAAMYGIYGLVCWPLGGAGTASRERHWWVARNGTEPRHGLMWAGE